MTGGLEQKSAAAGVETPVRGGLPGIEAADIEEEKSAPQTEAPAVQSGLPGAAVRICCDLFGLFKTQFLLDRIFDLFVRQYFGCLIG